MRPTIVPKKMTAIRLNEITTAVYEAPDCGLRQMGVDLLAELMANALEIEKLQDQIERESYTYEDCDCSYCTGDDNDSQN